jgi:hypothetical protein
MKQWLKITLWVLAAIIGTVIIGYGGCVGCAHLMRVSNSCELYNIDNVELRAHIDIPSIETEDCSCKLDKTENTKINYFKIRTSAVNMNRYVERNSFMSVNEINMDLSVFDKFSKIPEITSDNMQNYYYNSGQDQRTDWLTVLNKASGDLWVYMKYKD